MTAYISRDDSYALEHHGVKGMKWGVRKNYGTLGTSRRLANKQAYLQKRIDSTDNSTRTKRIANAYRSGRIQQLEYKKNVRADREKFMANRNKENAKSWAKSSVKYSGHTLVDGLLGGTASAAVVRGYAKTPKGSRQIAIGKALARETMNTKTANKAKSAVKRAGKGISTGAKGIKQRALASVDG